VRRWRRPWAAVARSDGSDRGGRGAAAWQGGRAGGIQLWAGVGAERARAVAAR